MKTHTSDFKNEIKKFGRQLDSIITYTIDEEEIELGKEDLNSITPHYEGSILKSVMKQLDIDSNVEIPEGTILNYQFGVKVDEEDGEDIYEYIDFGNYVVYKVEKQEDTRSYKITCYDKMLYSMVEYESLGVSYPIIIRDYLGAICTKLGLTFKNASDTFANYDKQILSELYLDSNGNSLDYTFRDVLDEIAGATGSTICINENDDELEIRYINSTNDIINAEFLKDINVNFGEATKPINTIVLSRSGGSDKVYLSYPENLPDDEKNAIEIADNQIMNFNDRDTYLSDILNKLNGLTYYLNDFSSTGICYYNLCDRYSVEIGNETYSCIMFNDEINVTQGLEENIYTEMPEETETDYTKADKTDRRINQTYLIVDKQNGVIESVVRETVDTTNPDSIATKQSVLTQRVDTLESEISNVTGMVQTKESYTSKVTFTDSTNASEPISITLYPITYNISYLYPRSNLYPSDSLYSSNRKLRFRNRTTNENIDYELPDDLLYYDSEHYDEFYLDLNSQTCQVTKRCKYNADGTVGLLSAERIDSYTYPLIQLTEGVYTVYVLGQDTLNGYLSVTLMASNIYTDQFYTKVETDSKISQSANNITLAVNQTLSNYSTTNEMNSAINLKANEINSNVSQTYSTKTQTTQAKNEAINSSNSYTDSELGNYSTTTQMNASITQKIENNNTAYVDIEVGKKVNNTDYTHANIVAKINDNTSQVQINANKIDLTGYVTASDLSGTSTTTIDGSNITTGIIKSSNYVANTSGTAINLTNGSIDTKNFKVNSTGEITSTSGYIGGWKISNNKLESGSGSSYVRLDSQPATSVSSVMWCGAEGADNAPFRVSKAGALTATNATIRGSITATSGSFTGSLYSSNGTIGGWTLNNNGLSANGTYQGVSYVVKLTPLGIEISYQGGGGKTIRWIDL